MWTSPVIRPSRPADRKRLIALLADFRVALDALLGEPRPANLQAAAQELEAYEAQRFPIWVAQVGERLVGFLVCRVDQGVVWAEALYVEPAYRRRGIGSQLYAQAEDLAQRLGQPTVYNWVHPNNHAILALLARRGYRVLNLIEVRRPLPGETLAGRLTIAGHTLAYPVPVEPPSAETP